MPPSSTRPRTLAWSNYLACSWTWCIGMFLPVLFVRDFGLWGWVVFTVPNVIGAAAVGFFTYGETRGLSLLERHRGAMAAFSVVTIVFHIAFAAWLIRMLIGLWGLALPFGATALFYGFLPRKQGDLRACAFTMLISLVVAVVCLANHGVMRVGAPGWSISPTATRDLACLAPGIALAFLLCPHLDLTLQRARREVGPGAARRVFVVGFGVLFLAAILFTLYYAGFIQRVLAGDPVALATRVVLIALGVHMSLQSAMTAALHLRELPVYRMAKRRPTEMAAVFIAIAGLIWWLSQPLPTWFGRSAGEVVYRAFLGFYGLVFPVYIWIAMIWRPPAEGAGPSRGAWITMGCVVLVILPFFAGAFLAHQAIWALPGVGLILLSPLALPRGRAS